MSENRLLKYLSSEYATADFCDAHAWPGLPFLPATSRAQSAPEWQWRRIRLTPTSDPMIAHLCATPEVTGELVRQSLRIASLELEVAELRARLDRNSSHAPEARPYRQDPRLLDLCSLTQELFGCIPSFESAVDPDEPDFPFVVVTVDWSGDPRELIQRRIQWHERVRGLAAGDSGKLRLSVMPS